MTENYKLSRIGFTFSRTMELSHISHLDMMRLFIRALRRSNLPLDYSQGFNPHPHFALALPLPLGVTAGEELGEVYFKGSISPEMFLNILVSQMPPGVTIITAYEVDLEEPAISALVQAALYRATLSESSSCSANPEMIQSSLDRLMAREEIIMKRINKKKKIVSTNVRPFIHKAEMISIDKKPLDLLLLLQAGSIGGISPVFFLEQLKQEAEKGEPEPYHWRLHREKIIFKNN